MCLSIDVSVVYNHVSHEMRLCQPWLYRAWWSTLVRMGYMTATEVAEALSISYRDLRKLNACGVLSGERIGSVTAYDEEEVARLGEPFRSEYIPSDEVRGIAVRMGTPEPFEDPLWPERHWIGWHAQWPEERKRDAARGWWKIAPSNRRPGLPLVVLVGPVVVEVYDIRGDDTPRGVPGGVCRLAIGRATKEQKAEWERRIIRLGPGAMSTPI